jgi:ComF family protein
VGHVPSAVLRRVRDLVVPGTCAACGVVGPPACPACLGALAPLPPPLCAGCGHPHAAPAPRCRECRGRLAGARQGCLYTPVAAHLVAALKDGRRRDVAEVLARVVAARCPPPPSGAVLVPVPLSVRRQRERGFNQSALLAERLAARWGAPVRADLLLRVQEQPPQRGSAREDRIRQVAGAFAVPPGVAPPSACLLVDDVHTTGATLAACASALHRAGVRTVGAVAFSRALRT